MARQGPPRSRVTRADAWQKGGQWRRAARGLTSPVTSLTLVTRTVTPSFSTVRAVRPSATMPFMACVKFFDSQCQFPAFQTEPAPSAMAAAGLLVPSGPWVAAESAESGSQPG